MTSLLESNFIFTLQYDWQIYFKMPINLIIYDISHIYVLTVAVASEQNTGYISRPCNPGFDYTVITRLSTMLKTDCKLENCILAKVLKLSFISINDTWNPIYNKICLQLMLVSNILHFLTTFHWHFHLVHIKTQVPWFDLVFPIWKPDPF